MRFSAAVSKMTPETITKVKIDAEPVTGLPGDSRTELSLNITFCNFFFIMSGPYGFMIYTDNIGSDILYIGSCPSRGATDSILDHCNPAALR